MNIFLALTNNCGTSNGINLYIFVERKLVHHNQAQAQKEGD